MLKTKTSQQMQTSFLDAKAVLAGTLHQAFVPESLDDWQALDVIMEKSVLAYSIDEFKTEFGCLPESIGIEPVDWTDERGQAMRMVFLQDPAEPHRRIRIQNKTGLLLQKKISTVQEQLRPRQSADLMKTIMSKRLKSDPLLKTKSIAEIHALAQEGKEKEAQLAAELEKQKAASTAPPLQSALAAAAAAASAKGPDDPLEEAPPQSVLVDSIATTAFAAYTVNEMGEQEDKKKAKGPGGRKPKEKAKASAKRKGGELSPLSKFARKSMKSQHPSPSHTVSGSRGSNEGNDAEYDVGSMAGSMKTGAGKRSAAGASAAPSQAMKYVADLSLDAALSGHSLKGPLYHSRRWLTAEREKGEIDSPEFVTLSAKFYLANNAIRLFSLLGGPATTERAKLLEEVMRYTKALPTAFCSKHLTALVREEPLKTEASVGQWLLMVEPRVSGHQILINLDSSC